MEKPPTFACFRLLILVSVVCPAGAANPYLHLASGKPVVSRWSGSEWGDRIEARSEEGRPLSATVTTRRLAQMPWGQIVRMRFEVDGGRTIRPVYLLVRDEVILELASDDMEYLIGAIAAMGKPPHFDPQDVRGASEDGKRESRDGSGKAEVTVANGRSTYLWSHPSGHFRKFVWVRGEGLVEYAVGSGARQDGFRLFPAGPEGILDSEKPGGL